MPVLKQHSCPYYDLAEVDRAVCAMERKMFEKVLGRGLRLSQCRLDGHRSCDFEAKPIVDATAGLSDGPSDSSDRSGPATSVLPGPVRDHSSEPFTLVFPVHTGQGLMSKVL